jgi:hypothetical protein
MKLMSLMIGWAQEDDHHRIIQPCFSLRGRIDAWKCLCHAVPGLQSTDLLKFVDVDCHHCI